MVWNPLNIFRSRREKARKIEEEVEALRRMGTYKEKPRGELLEEVRKRGAGREFAGKVEEEARRMPLALPAPRGRERAENILNRFREGRISDAEAESEILDLARNGLITETDAQYAIMLIPKIRGIRDRPGGLVRTGKFLRPALESTAEGGLRPTMQQIRTPLYGKVRNTATQMEKLDPEIRSAINKARLELQKKSVAIKVEFDRETTRIKSESQPIEAELKRLRDALEKTNREINEELTKEESPGAQQAEGGGAMGGLGG